MKELQAGLQLVRNKCIQLNRHPVFKKKALPQQRRDGSKGTSKADCPNLLFPFPVSSSSKGLRQQTTQGLKQLKNQAERINQLSAELEAAVFELKAIASEVNRDWKATQAMQKPTRAIADICNYQTVYLPIVYQKSSGSLVLTSRTVDLFKAEREAALLAQTLRQRAKRKRLKG